MWRVDPDGLAFIFSNGIKHRLIRAFRSDGGEAAAHLLEAVERLVAPRAAVELCRNYPEARPTRLVYRKCLRACSSVG